MRARRATRGLWRGLPALLALTLALAAPTARAAAPKPPGRTMTSILPFPVERHTLPNGLTVLFVPMSSNGLVAYWTVVRTGSRDEVEAGVTGFAHFFEHMMFRGSKRFPADVYDGIVKRMGADANAYTTDDYTAYHLSLGAEDLPEVITIEADRFQHLDYDEAAFKTEAGAVYGEFRKGRTDPFEVLIEALQNTAWETAGIYDPTHRYRSPDWVYGVELAHLLSLFDETPEILRETFRELGRLSFRSTYDRVFLYRCVAQNASPRPKQFAQSELLPLAARREIRERILAFHDTHLGEGAALSPQAMEKWRAGLDERLGL